MNVLLEDLPILKAWEKYKKTTDHRFYRMTHFVVLAVLFELLIRIFWTDRVVEYNGADLWFKIPFHWLPLPGGTLLIILYPMVLWGYRLFLDWKGIKDRAERDKDKKEKKDHEDAEKRKHGKVLNEFKAKEKKPMSKEFNPWYWGFIALEGFAYSVVIFSLLDLVVFAITFAATGDVIIPPTLDRNPALYDLHSNVGLDVALAIGGGFYEEAAFRWGLPLFLTWLFTTFIKNYKLTPAQLSWSVVLIYALSHYLPYFGDYLSMYSFLYRLAFGYFMNVIYQKRGLPVAMWTHLVHDGFYFLWR
jgi:hypothetical protein